MDTTRADALSCYGAEAGRTPTSDRLAAEGVLFERAISASALTPVSPATILTGTSPYRHGLRVMAAETGGNVEGSVPNLDVGATSVLYFSDTNGLSGTDHLIPPDRIFKM